MTIFSGALLWSLIAVQNPEVDSPPPPSIEFETRPSLSPAPPPEFAPWSVGIGIDVWTGFGSVFNDMGGPSLNIGYRIDERWGVGLRLFKSDFDFEDPADFVFGRSGTPVADASIDLLSVTASARWHFLEPGGIFDFYVGGGVGFAFPDSGEAVNLPQVDISVEGKAGPEVHIALGGSVRVFEQFHVSLELRTMKSFTEYEVVDRQNGQEETEEGFSGIGFAFGAEYRF